MLSNKIFEVWSLPTLKINWFLDLIIKKTIKSRCYKLKLYLKIKNQTNKQTHESHVWGSYHTYSPHSCNFADDRTTWCIGPPNINNPCSPDKGWRSHSHIVIILLVSHCSWLCVSNFIVKSFCCYCIFLCIQIYIFISIVMTPIRTKLKPLKINERLRVYQNPWERNLCSLYSFTLSIVSYFW